MACCGDLKFCCVVVRGPSRCAPLLCPLARTWRSQHCHAQRRSPSTPSARLLQPATRPRSCLQCKTRPTFFAWSGSRVSGSHMTLKTLELWGLAPSFSNFSDFEFLTGQHFSDFGSRIILRIRSNPTSRRRKSNSWPPRLERPRRRRRFFWFCNAKIAIS